VQRPCHDRALGHQQAAKIQPSQRRQTIIDRDQAVGFWPHKVGIGSGAQGVGYYCWKCCHRLFPDATIGISVTQEELKHLVARGGEKLRFCCECHQDLVAPPLPDGDRVGLVPREAVLSSPPSGRREVFCEWCFHDRFPGVSWIVVKRGNLRELDAKGEVSRICRDCGRDLLETEEAELKKRPPAP
jgi:hypothetical protein